MNAKVVALIFLGSIVLVRADQMIERVQGALKDQGFYYGEITGETNANLTAAIRRYQIRNGLQVNGELNSETLRSLGIDSSASAQSAAKFSPSPSPNISNLGDESSRETAGAASVTAPPFTNAPQGEQTYPSNPISPGPLAGGLFAGTPYETAPSRIQQNVVLSAQIALAPTMRSRSICSSAGSARTSIWSHIGNSGARQFGSPTIMIESYFASKHKFLSVRSSLNCSRFTSRT